MLSIMRYIGNRTTMDGDVILFSSMLPEAARRCPASTEAGSASTIHRIHRFAGESHEVSHPENVVRLKTRLIIGYPETDSAVPIGLIHVNSIQQLQAA